MRALIRVLQATLATLTFGVILLGSSSCGDEYTYFTLQMFLKADGANAITLAERKEIDRCTLNVTNAAGEPVESFTLKSGIVPGSDTHFGCSFDETPSFIGLLNYSSLRKNGNLTFELNAGSGEGGQFRIIATGKGTGSVNPGKSVSVEIIATRP
jgi:hypothetical protein